MEKGPGPHMRARPLCWCSTWNIETRPAHDKGKAAHFAVKRTGANLRKAETRGPRAGPNRNTATGTRAGPNGALCYLRVWGCGVGLRPRAEPIKHAGRGQAPFLGTHGQGGYAGGQINGASAGQAGPHSHKQNRPSAA